MEENEGIEDERENIINRQGGKSVKGRECGWEGRDECVYHNFNETRE